MNFNRNAGAINRQVLHLKQAELFGGKSILLYLQPAAAKVVLWHDALQQEHATNRIPYMTNIWLQVPQSTRQCDAIKRDARFL